MVSVIHLSISFWGVLRGLRFLLLLSIKKEVKAGQSCFKRSGLQCRFLTEIRIRCSIFTSNSKKDICPLFRSAWKIFPPHAVTILSTMAQLEINISDRSSMATATYNRSGVIFLTKIFDCAPVRTLGSQVSLDTRI